MVNTVKFAALAFLILAAGCVARESSPGIAQPGAPSSVAAPPASAAPAPSALTDFSCDLSLGDPPATVRAGSELVAIRVKVVNRSKSGETWRALIPGAAPFGAVNLAYHWTGRGAAIEGDRALLPADLQPGRSEEVTLKVKPPAAPGAYTLRIEPVQESVAWFSDRGGCFRDVKVEVTK